MIQMVIADDENRICSTIKYVVSEAFPQVRIAAVFDNGRDLQDYISANHVDLLITDIEMPQMNGLEIVHQMRERGNNCYVIVITAYRDFDYAMRALNSKVNTFLTKPFSSSDLEREVRNAIEAILEERQYITKQWNVFGHLIRAVGSSLQWQTVKDIALCQGTKRLDAISCTEVVVCSENGYLLTPEQEELLERDLKTVGEIDTLQQSVFFLEKCKANVSFLIFADAAPDLSFIDVQFGTMDACYKTPCPRKPGADTHLTEGEIDFSLIDEARVFHFGTLSLTNEPARTATKKAVAYAKRAGKLISYDPNLRKPLWNSMDDAKKQLLWGLSQADVVKISDEKVEFLFGLDAAKGAQYILENYNVTLVFVTCGGDGCYFMNHNASGHVPGMEGIKVIDTTGAGDIFGGSAMWKLLQFDKTPAELTEAELIQVVTFACVSAGLSTTKNGGISSVPALEDVLCIISDVCKTDIS